MRKKMKKLKSVICFGAGMVGHDFIAITKNKVNIEYFVDNGQSGQIENYKIYKPSAENCGGGRYIVVTSSLHYQSIKKQLEGYGLRETYDFASAADFLLSNSELMNRNWEKDQFKLHLYLRKKKAVYCALRYLGQFAEKKSLIVETYQKAVILPLKRYPEDQLWLGRGGVVEQSGKYVQLSCIEERLDGKYDYDNPQYRNESVVYCGYFNQRWGHFLIEVIARLWFFLKYDNLSYKYVYFVANAESVILDGNYKEFFRLLGILDRIEIINEPVQYREVIVPQVSYNRMYYYSDDYKNILSTVINNAMLECRGQRLYDKVFFSRSRWGKAEYGLDMLDDFFDKNGFKVVCPETLTLTQMIFILQKADTVAAVSGSTAHNILFGKDGQEFIIMERCAINNWDQTNINRIKQLNVTYIDANLAFFPVSYGSGPFFLYCSKFLKSYAIEKKWDLPEQKFMSETYVKNNLKMYEGHYDKMRNARDPYRICDEVFQEAYYESMREIKNDSFDLSHMIPEEI